MWKTALIAVGVLAAAPLLASESPAPVGNKVTTTTHACPQTGTLLRAKPGRCVQTSPIRSYTREDIERTGALDLGQALRLLDPAFL